MATNNNKLQRNGYFASKKTPRRGNIWLKIIGIVALLAVGFSAAWASKAYFSVVSAAKSAYHANGNVSKNISEKKPISILLLGVDTGIEGRTDQGNSDTMIVATANPTTKKASLTSIPRDLLTEIADTKDFYMSRINSSYNVNGADAAQKTVSDLLNIPIDYYVAVDMAALENLVDAVGGIDINVKFDFTYNTTFKKGKMHVNGMQALDYARMRKDDPEGDYGRQKRQREVIEAILTKGMSLDSVSNYQKILKVVQKYVKTNLSFDDMMGLIQNYRGVAGNIKSTNIQGHDAWIGGGSYQVASTSELQKVSDTLRKNLDLKQEKLDNEIVRQNSLQKGLDWKNLQAFENYIIYDQNSDAMPWQG